MASKVFEKEKDGGQVDVTAVDIGTQKPPSLEQYSAALSLADLVMALKASMGNDDESMRKKAAFEAEAFERLRQKERVHPGISVFSYPEGDVAHPKPPLKCPMFWVGYDEMVENLTPQEVDLFNSAEPGVFQYHKTDGTTESLTITAQRDPAGKISKLEFHFPCRGENRNNQPSKVAMLREAQGKLSREDELLAEIAALQAERQKLVEA